MLYVRQSLSPGEKLIHIGRFHWFYTATAVSWLVIGAALAYLVIHVAVYMDIMAVIKGRYGVNLSESDQALAFDMIVASKGGLFQVIMHLNTFIKLGAFLMLFSGMVLFANMIITLMVTEIAITSSRLIYKKGLISRYIGEINIDKIEGVTVSQSILGRIFGYGRIIVRGLGVGEVALPPIEKPITFRRAIDKAKSL